MVSFFHDDNIFRVVLYYVRMIDTSFDCVSSPEENEGSMNKIGREMKAGVPIKDLTQ